MSEYVHELNSLGVYMFEHRKFITLLKLSSLISIGLSTVPTRASLIADLSMGRVQAIVPQELVTLYHALEVDFQPLKLAHRVQPALERIAENVSLSAYLEPLQEVVVSKTLLQLSQVYRTLRFDELVRLCPFYDPLTLERCVIELIYNLELPMRVDHRRQAIIFDVYIDLGISQRDYSQSMQSSQVSMHSSLGSCSLDWFSLPTLLLLDRRRPVIAPIDHLRAIFASSCRLTKRKRIRKPSSRCLCQGVHCDC